MPRGNPNAKGTMGNRGGGRLGYTYERDQLIRLRKIVDRGIAAIEAYQKGRLSAGEIEKFKLIMPVMLKAMDKLHPNKQQLDLPILDDTNGLSELTIFFRAIASPKQIDDTRRYPSLPSGSPPVQE